MRESFSSGLSILDEQAGGIQTGDAILYIVGSRTLGTAFLERFITQSDRNKSPIAVFTLSGNLATTFQGEKNIRVIDIGGSNRRLPVGRVRAALTAIPKKSLIVLEDLSAFHSAFGEAMMLKMFRHFAQRAAKNRTLFLTSIVRQNVWTKTLVKCRDIASVCIDTSQHGRDVYCSIISARGRYSPASMFPVKVTLTPEGKIRGLREPGDLPTSPPGRTLDEAGGLFPDDTAQEMFQSTPVPMVIVDRKGDRYSWNRRSAELLQYDPTELASVHPLGVVSPGSRRQALRFIVDLRTRRKRPVTIDVRKKNGSIVPVRIIASDLRDGYHLCTAQDISSEDELKAAVQRKDDELSSVLDNDPMACLIIQKGKPVHANPAFYALFTLIDVSLGESLELRHRFSPISLRSIQRLIRSAESSASSGPVEAEAIRADGTVFDAAVSISEIRYLGMPSVRLGIHDISPYRSVIRTLTAVEERSRMLLDNSPEAACLVRDGRIEYANSGYCRLFGINSADEVTGSDVIAHVSEADRPKALDILQKKTKGNPLSIVLNGLRKDKEILLIAWWLVPIHERYGHWLLYVRDVTAQKQLEREAQERAGDLRLLEDVGIALKNSSDFIKIERISLGKVLEVLSWESGAFYLADDEAQEIHIGTHRNLPEGLQPKLDAFSLEEGIGGLVAKTHDPQIFTLRHYPSYLPHRSLFHGVGVTAVCFLPLVAKEKLVGMVVACTRKPVDHPLRPPELLRSIGMLIGESVGNALSFKRIAQLEARHNSLINSVTDTLYSAEANGRITFVSPAVERLLGSPPREFYRNSSLWLKLVHADDKRILLERTTRLNELGDRHTCEYRMMPRGKASYRLVRDAISLTRDGSGAVTGYSGILTDVTEYRELTDALRRSNDLTSSLISSIEAGVMVVSRDGLCTMWNQQMEKMTGIPHSDALGRTAADLFPEFGETGFAAVFEKVLGGVSVSIDDLTVRSTILEKPFIALGRFTPLRGSDDRVTGVAGVMTDISRSKRLESEIRESEQILRNVIDTMGDVLILTDLKGEVLQVNRTFLRVLGYTRAEAIGHDFPYPWLLEEEMGRYVLWIATLREQSWLHDFDMTWKVKDGSLISVSLSTTLLRNSMGEPIAMLNIARDITERRRLGYELEGRNKQIEFINRIITKANETLDFDEIFDVIGKEVRDIVPYDEINVGLLAESGTELLMYALIGSPTFRKGDSIPIGETVSQFAIKERLPVVIADLWADERHRHLRSYKEGYRSHISLPISMKGRMLGTLSITNREPYSFNEETVEILLPIAQQVGAIIDRIRLIRQVSDDVSYIHNLLDSIDNIVYTVDTKYRIREVNRAWHEFIQESGITTSVNYQGMNLFDVLPSESLKVAFQNNIDQLLNGTVRYYSQEFHQAMPGGTKIHQITINPMIIDKKITGLVFTHADITAQKTTESELKKSNEQLLALNEISGLINSSFDLNEILETAIPLLHKNIDSTSILIYLLDEVSGDLVLAMQAGYDLTQHGSIVRLTQTNSATGFVMRTREPLFIPEHVHRDERVLPPNREVLKNAGIEAMAVIPLMSKEKVLGAMDIFYDRKHIIYAGESQLLALVGNQIGAAIENAQLYSELRAQINRLTVLYELSEQLTSTLDVDHIVQVVYQHLLRVVPCERISIDLCDEPAQRITPVLAVETVGSERIMVPKLPQPRAIDRDTPEWHVATTKQPYQRDTLMVVPMLSKENIIGIMSVASSAAGMYSHVHLRLLESIANLTAIAIEKGKLYEETVQKSMEIGRRNKELDDFTYVVSHDLKEPLISIEGFSNILLLDYKDIIQAEGLEYMESIVGASGRMKKLIDDLLMLSRVSRPSESFKNVSIRQIVDDIVTDMEYTIRQKGVTMVVPEILPTVIGNETHLKIAFRNLIGNAIKFNASPSPSVEIGFHNGENNYYLFYVRDNGIGIDRQFHEKVFVIFQRLHRREEYEGTGAGLAIVKKIIEMHHGKIWVESEPGKGSTFYFTIEKMPTKE